MNSLLRPVGVLLLVAACLFPALLFAQETSGTEGVTLAGSGLITPALEAAASAAGTPLTVDVIGSQRGLEALCQNRVDLAAASRSLNESEGVSCASLGVEFSELLFGYQIAAFVTSPESTFAECLTLDQLNTVFAPSSSGQITDWSQVSADNPSAPLSIVLPTSGPLPDLLDGIISGDGVRTDAARVDAAAVVPEVNAAPNAIGVIDLPAALAAGDSLRVLSLNVSPAGCTAPSAGAVDAGTYTAALPLYVYANASALDRAEVTALLTTAFSADFWADPAVAALSQPTEAIAASNLETIETGRTGRVFSAEENAFTIPSGVTGAVTAAGSAAAADFFTASTGAFSSLYPGVTITSTIDGQAAGFRRLCNGEVDLALAFSDLSAEQAENCAANNITTYTLELGRQAAILVANGNSSYLQCLTVPQIVTTFSAESAAAVMNWSQVDAAFPETPLTLFTPEAGSVLTDLLMLTGGSSMPTRVDIQLDNDAAYRAAATANVDGGLALLSWADYQDVVSSGQQNITLVSVDAGSGCVEPSFTSIADGSYPLTRPARVIVNTTALNRAEVQSALWYLVSDENFPQFSVSELVGVTFESLADLRAGLQTAFTEAAAAAATTPEEPSAEATPEATPEAGAEATPEATPAS